MIAEMQTQREIAAMRNSEEIAMMRNSEGDRREAKLRGRSPRRDISKGSILQKGENKILNSAKERMQDKVPKQPLITRM
jgi:hypothetical protein